MSGYRFVPDAVIPSTEPAASRLVPPTYPPAPPGTGSAGGNEDPRGVATSLPDMLDMAFTPVSSIRAMLAALETVPLDGPLAPVIRDSIGSMRELAAGLLESIHHKIQPLSQRFLATDLDMVKRDLLRMAAHGIERKALDRWVLQRRGSALVVFQGLGRTEAAAEGRLPDQRYYFPLPEYLTASHLGLMAQGKMVRAIVADLRRKLMQDEALVSQHAFDLLVTQQLHALDYVASLATPKLLWPPMSGARLTTPQEEDLEERRIREWRERRQR